jgi:hypothetical protein
MLVGLALRALTELHPFPVVALAVKVETVELLVPVLVDRVEMGDFLQGVVAVAE